MSKINFEEDQQEVIQNTGNLQTLADQVEKLNSLQQRIELQEDNLKNTKKEFDHLSGEVIPTMMAEMGLSHLKLMDGSSVDVKPNYSASISIANREKAFTWLRENGLGDIIKNEISVAFGRNERTVAGVDARRLVLRVARDVQRPEAAGEAEDGALVVARRVGEARHFCGRSEERRVGKGGRTRGSR